ncbi:NAD-dependent deacetylase sirtuin 1 [Rhodotorula toruloides]|uniref:NAD-dependent deacetylase sirtuin 1 n=1 Tax=Rhodotorula toruloides TaxID=5286 RepID=A0A511KGC1_RHOTO|nr:NAD-dependent deacetylase sirtuin 1 [Rhodotorula toruloides]
MDPDSSVAQPLPAAQLAPPGPALATFPAPVPNYQDLTDESPSEDDEQDWDSLVSAVERNFSEQQIDDMHEFLKERGLFAFLKEYLERRGVPPSTLLLVFGVMVRPDLPMNDQLRMLKIACSRVLRNRDKLMEYNAPQDVVDLIRKSKRILVLTGAGVSTSCGIPDFRSPTGLYARLREQNSLWDLDDPQDMFDLAYFKRSPNVFYSFAKEIYPSNFVPSPCHRFVRLLEMEGKLLRNYTQNIDGLFEQVGVERMLNCHGSFATASCLICRRRFPGTAIERDVFSSRVPLCPFCTPELEAAAAALAREREERPKKKRRVGREEWEGSGGSSEEDESGEGRSEWEGKALIKPDIVFFGEALSDEFDHRLLQDREEVDLLIVMGTSLRVSPVAQLPSHLPHSIPQILINRDPVPHQNFDVCLLGDGDTIVRWLCEELNKTTLQDEADEEKKEEVKKQWDLDSRVPVHLPEHKLPPSASSAADAQPDDAAPPHPSLPATTPSTASITPEQVGHSHVWLFPGANRESRWVQSVRVAYGSDREDSEEGEVAGDGPIELPASLAPGVIEGEGSDGSDDSDLEDGSSGGKEEGGLSNGLQDTAKPDQNGVAETASESALPPSEVKLK